MAKKSDNADEVLSATDASRSFSKLLNDVEAGGRFLIQRRGRAICAMAPPPVESRKVSECVALLRGRPPVLLDEGFGDDLADLIDGEPLTEPPKWAS